jgi:Kef-type K+ transport system membrane component KefB
LGTGIAWRLRISPLTALFVMGICISVASRHAAELRPVLARTEPAVLLPTLLLSGALLRFEASAALWWILVATLVARTLVRGGLGYLLARATGARAEQRLPLGLGLSCSGPVCLLVGLSFAFRFPGSIGNMVLTAAACSAVLGDVLGPAGLRYALVPNQPPSAAGSDKPRALTSTP